MTQGTGLAPMLAADHQTSALVLAAGCARLTRMELALILKLEIGRVMAVGSQILLPGLNASNVTHPMEEEVQEVVGGRQRVMVTGRVMAAAFPTLPPDSSANSATLQAAEVVVVVQEVDIPASQATGSVQVVDFPILRQDLNASSATLPVAEAAQEVDFLPSLVTGSARAASSQILPPGTTVSSVTLPKVPTLEQELMVVSGRAQAVGSPISHLVSNANNASPLKLAAVARRLRMGIGSVQAAHSPTLLHGVNASSAMSLILLAVEVEVEEITGRVTVDLITSPAGPAVNHVARGRLPQ